MTGSTAQNSTLIPFNLLSPPVEIKPASGDSVQLCAVSSKFVASNSRRISAQRMCSAVRLVEQGIIRTWYTEMLTTLFGKPMARQHG
jgi:hypothetical protein